eukprot:CAMPEP_0197844460 /NCGR_PEP_ID=MMETSP1438-20131217/1441_1 /TAXON_ID=1461541 /ORGANISM="Pterosperma sp., Strain CCMP1384" /LENGTH=292 /DNA_ID=CAMNT_0043455245 /DNA_START=117 /DNA_END=995 /DNA_ORIENTATION=+
MAETKLGKRKSTTDIALPVPIGVTSFHEHRVVEADTAYTQHTGGVRTLSTAKLSQIVEDACVQSIAHLLEEGYGTAGCAVNMRHRAPMAVGTTVQLEVSVKTVRRKQITFEFQAVDAEEQTKLVAIGTHQRVYMKVEEMAASLRKKRVDPRSAEIKEGLEGMSVHYVDERDVGSIASTPSTPKDDFEGVQAVTTSTLMTWAEEAAIAALEEYLPPGKTTVGGETSVCHMKPTPKGMTVTCTAKLREVNGKKLLFDVTGEDRQEKVLQGTHLRFLVDKEVFESSAQRGSTSGM